MTTARSKSDQTKAHIMRAAVHLFTQRGYEGSTLRDIAKAAQVQMGLIRYHFGNKADLYRDSLAHLSHPYKQACLDALEESLQAQGQLEDTIYAWLAAPYTHWDENELVTGEEFLCFLNKMGYEPAELTHDVYESHYSYALQQWKEALRSHLNPIAESDWMWCLSCLRGIYFHIISQQECALWGLPPIYGKEPALRRLASDIAQQLRKHATQKSGD